MNFTDNWQGEKGVPYIYVYAITLLQILALNISIAEYLLVC